MKPVLMLVSDAAMEVSGGAQESIRILAEGLSDRYEINTFSPGKMKINDLHHNVPEYSTFNLKRNGLMGFLRISLLLHKEIRRLRPDIIHLQMSSTTIMFHFLRRAGLVPRGTKIILTDRGVYGKASRPTTWSINYLLTKASALVTTTENNRGNYARLYPKYAKHREKFRVIPNTAGMSFEAPEAGDRDDSRETLGLSPESLVLGFCGRFSAEKNWPLAKDIAGKCVERIPGAEVIMILGTNRSEDRVKRAKGYIESVRVLIGERLHAFIDIPADRVSEIYKAMDAFILTSTRESFGRTAIEAMARSTVVLGTRVDGLPEVIGDERFLYDTAEEASDLVQKLARDPSFADESKGYFLNRYSGNYSEEINLELHHRLYQEVLGMIDHEPAMIADGQ